MFSRKRDYASRVVYYFGEVKVVYEFATTSMAKFIHLWADETILL